jgi:DNA-binding XRE family transcriptional regulator
VRSCQWWLRAHMVQHFHSYLRPLRRRWGFTQGELAFLIGYETGKSISRIEALQQTPTLNTALSCSVIFNIAPVKLFPGALSDAEQRVFARASELYEELQGDSSRTARIKLDFLEVLLARLESTRTAGL